MKNPWILTPGCHIFRGNGCKFIDISTSLEYWETRPRQDHLPSGTYYYVQSLVRDLENRVQEWEEYIDYNNELIDRDDEEHTGSLPELGILACVWDE